MATESEPASASRPPDNPERGWVLRYRSAPTAQREAYLAAVSEAIRSRPGVGAALAGAGADLLQAVPGPSPGVVDLVVSLSENVAGENEAYDAADAGLAVLEILGRQDLLPALPVSMYEGLFHRADGGPDLAMQLPVN